MEYETKISSQQGATAANLAVHKTAKQRGELAELAFMYKAAGLGFGVAKPYGDSERFDFILSFGKQLWRVQVKSTYGLQGTGYRVPGQSTRFRRKYTPAEIDFLVAYIVPLDLWYVVPVAALESENLRFYPSGCRLGGRYEKYREAWHLMRPPAVPNP
jgi:PD-(D/E)XK endonuclease